MNAEKQKPKIKIKKQTKKHGIRQENYFPKIIYEKSNLYLVLKGRICRTLLYMKQIFEKAHGKLEQS